jgi:hypothetical protein
MLVKFREQLSGGAGDGALSQPPYALRAGDLDKNFELCYPVPLDGGGSPYTIERPGGGGWYLRGTKIFDVCENGQPVRYRVFAAREPDQEPE